MMLVESVKDNLRAYGYIATLDDEYIISSAIEKSITRVKAFTNLKELPEEINSIIIDMATGEVLSIKNAIGALSSGDGVKSIQEGDTTVTFAGESDMSGIIKKLIDGHFQALTHYRQVKW